MRSLQQSAALAMLSLLALLLCTPLCSVLEDVVVANSEETRRQIIRNGGSTRVSNVHCTMVHGNTVDLQALLDFKKCISSDPYGSLGNWRNGTHFCRWNGVHCTYTRPFRVLSLNLTRMNLTGQITSSLGNLTFLERLDLSHNFFSGAFPPKLGFLSNITHINFIFNQLKGSIPDDIGKLPKLQALCLGSNRFSGGFPHAILNMSASLRFLSLEINMLGNAIHPNIGDLLPHLVYLTLEGNTFQGHVPASLGNARGLEIIDLSNNSLTGQIPTSFGKLSNLTVLNLERNQLEARNTQDWEFLTALGNCTSLKALSFAKNKLQGPIPQSVGNLTPSLEKLYLSENNLSGQVPQSIGKLSSLTLLGLRGNNLSGTIEGWLGNLKCIRALNLMDNIFTGPIPSFISNLTQLRYLFLAQNEFDGLIPASLGNLPLIELYLGYNNFEGYIPPNFGNLQDLTMLDLGNNNLQGDNNLTQLIQLSLDQNEFNGLIPT